MTAIKDRAVQLAGDALRAYMADRKDDAHVAVQAICDETGSTGLAYAMCAWIDTASARLRKLGYLTGQPGQAIQPGWIDDSTWKRMAEDDVPEPHRWAARLAAAREALDQESWSALIREIPDDQHEASQYLWALLSGAARTIRNTPQVQSRRAGLS